MHRMQLESTEVQSRQPTAACTRPGTPGAEMTAAVLACADGTLNPG